MVRQPVLRNLAVVGATLGLISWAYGGVPTSSTQGLLDAKPGLRALFDGDRLLALYGVSFAENPNPSTSSETTDNFVNSWLNQNADVLGIDGLTLQYASRVNVRSNAFAIYYYTQTVEGLPLVNCGVKLRLKLGTTDKIGYASMRLVPIPSSALPPDMRDGAQAVAVIDDDPAYDFLTEFTAPQHVVFQTDDESLTRAWRFIGESSTGSYEFVINSVTGAVLSARDRTCYADVSGTVSGYATPGVLPDIPPTGPWAPVPDTNETVNTPVYFESIPFVQVTIPGHGSQYTDQFGDFTFQGLSTGQMITVQSDLGSV